MDLTTIIQTAKLGRERKAAQEDTCAVFACALMDVLAEQGIAAEATTASFYLLPSSQASWHHAVVKVGDRFFDSMGEITHESVRTRTKIHPKVSTRLDFKPDIRDDLEEEFVELHAFLVKKLRKAVQEVRQQEPEIDIDHEGAALRL